MNLGFAYLKNSSPLYKVFPFGRIPIVRKAEGNDVRFRIDLFKCTGEQLEKVFEHVQSTGKFIIHADHISHTLPIEAFVEMLRKPGPRCYSIGSVAAWLGISHWTLRRLIKECKVDASLIRGSWRIPGPALLELLEKGHPFNIKEKL